MNTNERKTDVLDTFGLTHEQTRIMFSIQRLMVMQDIEKTTNSEKRKLKREWLIGWERNIKNFLMGIDSNKAETKLYELSELRTAAINEIHRDIHNKTWYYIVLLEATLFVAYTPLGERTDEKFKGLKYSKQTEYLKTIVKSHCIVNEVWIDRFEKTYKKTMSKIKGTNWKIAIWLAITATATAIAAIYAGPIAVAIFGKGFTLSGAALTSACLAAAGGGAIAAGGAGMAGGVLVIAGGGALLGAAGGGVVTGVMTLAMKSSAYVLSQAAKLEVVLKEIVLNAQQDIKCAQDILKNYKNQINELKKELEILKRDDKENKEAIKEMKKSIEYMEKSFKNSQVFTSCFEIGMNNK